MTRDRFTPWLTLHQLEDRTTPSTVTPLTTEHVDLGIEFDHGELELHAHVEEPIDQEFELDEVALHAGLRAAQPRPDGSDFDFIGVAAGETIFVLPQDNDPQRLFLGVGAEEVDPTAFNGPLAMNLQAVDGPGEFAVWQVDGLGGITPVMATADGIDDTDQIFADPGAHDHYNWAFTAPGTYEVEVTVSGTLADGTAIESEPFTITYLVEPALLSTEHTDLGIEFEDGELELHAHVDDPVDQEFGTDEAVLYAGLRAAQPRPDGSDFDFIGVAAGETIFVLPQDNDPQRLFLGVGAEEVDPTAFNGPLAMNLQAVDGPGEFAVWQVDGLGGITPVMATADGIDDTDQIFAAPGTHEHYNWAFTAPGIYEVQVTVSGTLTDGTAIESEPFTITFGITAFDLEASDTPTDTLTLTGTDGTNYVTILPANGDPTGNSGIIVTGDITGWQPMMHTDVASILIQTQGGFDVIRIAPTISLPVTIEDSEGGTLIELGQGPNQVSTGDGFDNIRGLGGNDTINVGDGGSFIRISGGNNLITAGEGFDNITTGAGNDRINVGGGSGFIDAGDGDNQIQVGDGYHNITTGSGNDSVTVEEGSSFVRAGAGDDLLIGGIGRDHFLGEAGNDMLMGNAGNDVLEGGSGNDLIIGGTGRDMLHSGTGADRLVDGTAEGDPLIELLMEYMTRAADDLPMGLSFVSDNDTDMLFGDDDDELRFAGSNDLIIGS